MHALPPEAKRLEILAGLLKLRKDGHFVAIWATDRVKVQWEPNGPILLLGWRKAAEMVATAEKAAARAAAGDPPLVGKPAASERSQRARRAAAGRQF